MSCNKQSSAFVDEGFPNWRKALQRFGEHEKSEIHKEATVKLSARKSTVNITCQLSVQHESDTKFRQKMLLKVLTCIRYLARQGLLMRGHLEDNASF